MIWKKLRTKLITYNSASEKWKRKAFFASLRMYFYKKVFLKCAANLLEDTHTEVWFQ